MQSAAKRISFATRRDLLAAAVIITAGFVAKSHFAWAAKYPQAWTLPLQKWISTFFEWLLYEVRYFEGTAFEFPFTAITRGFVKVMAYPLSWSESLLYDGFEFGLAPIPWITLVGLAFILGYWIAGWRTALIGGASFLYLSLFSVWEPAMETFALVVITVPFVFCLGLFLAILMSKSRAVERALTPFLDVMQSMPPFAYLVPIVVLYGVGDVPAMVATAIFAVPPVTRCVLLGLKTLPGEVIEAGLMMGCSRMQMLWKVKLPTAYKTVMLGLNQGIMQTLAMVVLASLIGASGLGSKLLTSLQTLRLGQALEQGVAIVVIAVALDRLSQAYAQRPPVYVDKTLPLWLRHRYISGAFAFAAVSLSAAWFFPALRTLPDAWTITTAPMWDAGVDWVNNNLYDSVQGFRNFMLLKILIPIRDFCLWLPWPVVVGLVALLGLRHGGWRLAVLSGLLMTFPAVVGLWKQTMITVYMIGTASMVCIVVGFPIGLLASKNERMSKVILMLCDFFQTFPSFIYLIPMIMLFKVSDLSAIIAVLAFALVPMIRYTNLGLRNVPFETREAAMQHGATAWQRLIKVEMPIATPEIMLGVNQVIFMALFMVAITALIGTQDLGSEINRARTGNNTGKALVAGFCIALLGIIADRIITAWSKRRRAQMGMTH